MDERDYKAMNAEIKQEQMTAVEFLVQEINNLTGLTLALDEPCIEQAKEMEKQQIIDAYEDGQSNPYEYTEDNDVNWYNGKNYYINKFQNTKE